MPLKRTTTVNFRAEPGEGRTLTLSVSLHEDKSDTIVLTQDSDTIWISRADFAEIARQISEWEAGEPA